MHIRVWYFPPDSLSLVLSFSHYIVLVHVAIDVLPCVCAHDSMASSQVQGHGGAAASGAGLVLAGPAVTGDCRWAGLGDTPACGELRRARSLTRAVFFSTPIIAPFFTYTLFAFFYSTYSFEKNVATLCL